METNHVVNREACAEINLESGNSPDYLSSSPLGWMIERAEDLKATTQGIWHWGDGIIVNFLQSSIISLSKVDHRTGRFGPLFPP
jgi:hypothetical protein